MEQSMQRIEPTDACCVCMDEGNRDFLYKKCCSVLLCRKCYNQLEVESFPNHSTCPGCRKSFHKVGYSVDVVGNIAVPRAYCGALLSEAQCFKDHDAHVLSCNECLKMVIKGNSWFEKQLTDKFAGLKRKLQSTEDEVYVRNQRIRELMFQNAFLTREIARQSAVIEQVVQQNERLPSERKVSEGARRQLFPEDELETISVSSTEIEADSSESQAAPVTPPRQNVLSTSSRTTPPLRPARPRRNARAIQESTQVNTPQVTQARSRRRRVLQAALDENDMTASVSNSIL